MSPARLRGPMVVAALCHVCGAPAAMEAKGLELDDKTLDMVRRKSLEYAIRALSLTKEDAARLL